ncbi:MAG: purine-cytosine permease family protein [Candidatus Limnocylindrales bacterium]
MATARYGDRVGTLEPYSIEHVPRAERHGRSRDLLWLWLAANLTIADYALGFLPVSLGLPLGPTLAALAAGNLAGGALLALAAAMGPPAGYPQMLIGRRAFGHVGGYGPALLNWVSTAGWFTVNTILGAFAVQVLAPGCPFAAAALALVAAQVVLVVYGHNLIAAFERAMAALLGVLFAASTLLVLGHAGALAAWHPALGAGRLWPLVGIVLAGAFSYIVSWGPYASDYSRYLPETTDPAHLAPAVFAGSVLASFWLEVLGALIAILAPGQSNAVAALASVLGAFGPFAVLAIILGASAANALNLYSNSLSARALDLRWSRPVLVVLGGLLGLAFALAGAGDFTGFYSNFLLALDYWITPWLAVILVDFYLRGHRRPEGFGAAPAWNARGIGAYLLGLAASVPLMSASLFRGPLAAAFGGADLSYFVGFLVAGGAYLALTGRERRSEPESGRPPEGSAESR